MKKTKRRFFRGLMILGILMLLSGLVLFGYNRVLEYKAGKASESILSEIQKTIEEQQGIDGVQHPAPRPIELDGARYFGLLSIPPLDLNLPVQADWSYQKLRSTPCVYSGTIPGGDLVILAHNYSRHFGRIDDLRQGDEIVLTDAAGTEFRYFVQEVLVLDPENRTEMISSGYDLSLFTCTYGGKARITVRCMLQNQTDRYPFIEASAGGS